MNAAEYRAAAARIVTKPLIDGVITDEAFRRAEILAQLAISAAISEATEKDGPGGR